MRSPGSHGTILGRYGTQLCSKEGGSCQEVLTSSSMSLSHALRHSPFWVPRTGIERGRCRGLVHCQPNPNPFNQNAGLLWALPQAGRGLPSSRNVREQVQASLQGDAESQMEEVSSPNAEERNLNVETEVKKSTRRRRKSKAKIEDLASNVIQKEVGECLGEVSESSSLGTTLDSPYPGIGQLPLDSGGSVRDDASTRLKSSPSSSGTNDDGDQISKGTRKIGAKSSLGASKRSKKGKELLGSPDKPLSSGDIELVGEILEGENSLFSETSPPLLSAGQTDSSETLTVDNSKPNAEEYKNDAAVCMNGTTTWKTLSSPSLSEMSNLEVPAKIQNGATNGASGQSEKDNPEGTLKKSKKSKRQSKESKKDLTLLDTVSEPETERVGQNSFGEGNIMKESNPPHAQEGLPVVSGLHSTIDTSNRITEDNSSSHTKPPRRSRKKRLQKKSDPGALKTQAELGKTEDVFDSVIWCTVRLKAQAELEQDERLFVVGANPELGAWDLSLALPLPESEEEGCWETTFKVPRSTMLEYKYFTEIGTDSSIVHRTFGPDLQYFLPWKEGEGVELEIIRDRWIPDIPTKLPVLSWGNRWWEEIDSVETQIPKSEDDVDGIGYSGDVDHKDQQISANDVLEKVEEPVDTQQPQLEDWLKKKVRKRCLPREEPWLMESVIMAQINDTVRKKTEVADVIVEEVPKVEPEPPVQVEILINSPQCTMQRMAILEDGKLVELLIEPLNTKVQIGNVYLGVVKQLLPGMTGVFVDIGGFQLALLDITRNQYPYTFPSISQPGIVSMDDPQDSEWEGSDADDEEDDGEGGEDEEEDDVDDGEDEDLEEDEGTSRVRSVNTEVQGEEGRAGDQELKDIHTESAGRSLHPRTDPISPGPLTVNFGRKLKKWRKLQEGMHMIVQVKKEALGKKGPRLTAFPSLAGRFWVLVPGARSVGVSRRIMGPERKRLRDLAKDLLPMNFGLTVRSEALGHDREDIEKDLTRLMETWKEILERASSAAVAAEHGMEGAVPVLIHRAMGQTLTLVRDFFNDKVHKMVIDSPQCYQEVTSYLQEVAPQLSDRVELYTDKTPIFDAFNIESEIDKFSSKRVNLPNGGYIVLEETEALVSIDVNGGGGMLAHDISQEEAILAVNLAAARQIATELRLRDIGGIIVVDFIDMQDPNDEKLVLDEMRKAISRDRSSLSLSEISEFGLMEMTRKRVRPSVTVTMSDPCTGCSGVGRVEAHETTLSKIERVVRRLLAAKPGNVRTSDSSRWPQVTLRLDPVMGDYLKARKRKRITQLSAALKVWISLKVALEFTTGQFQVLEQQRPTGSEKRTNGAVQLKSNQQNIGPGLLKKRVWPGKRRRNFGNQVLNKDS